MLAALSGSAANFVFHGNVSGDMLDVANWYEVSGTPDVWNIPMNNGADWTFSDASRLSPLPAIQSVLQDIIMEQTRVRFCGRR